MPAWRFFEGLGPVPKVFYRLSQSETWIACPREPKPRHLGNLFLNAEGNLYLAKLGLIDEFLGELNTVDAEKSACFPLLRKLIEEDANGPVAEIKIEIDGEEVFRK